MYLKIQELKKKVLQKILRKKLVFFSIFPVLKVRHLGRKKVRFQTVWILKNFLIPGLNVISSRALGKAKTDIA